MHKSLLTNGDELVAKALADNALATWFRTQTSALEHPDSLRFRAALAACARRLRAAARTRFDLGGLGRKHWTRVDVGRFLLVHGGLANLPESEGARWFDQVLEAGELGEQVSLLRTLGALPQSERFAEAAISACRTNSVPVFEAIACENPYPAAVFEELHFNQMVIKAIFLEVSVRRIEGLAARNNDELVRMAQGLGSERQAAGRSIPADIAFIASKKGKSR